VRGKSRGLALRAKLQMAVQQCMAVETSAVLLVFATPWYNSIWLPHQGVQQSRNCFGAYDAMSRIHVSIVLFPQQC
jgi:hypothetical protein